MAGATETGKRTGGRVTPGRPALRRPRSLPGRSRMRGCVGGGSAQRGVRSAKARVDRSRPCSARTGRLGRSVRLPAGRKLTVAPRAAGAAAGEHAHHAHDRVRQGRQHRRLHLRYRGLGRQRHLRAGLRHSAHHELTGFDFTGPHPNVPEGGKRPRSSMTPTIALKDGNPAFSIGSPGGSVIPPPH